MITMITTSIVYTDKQGGTPYYPKDLNRVVTAIAVNAKEGQTDTLTVTAVGLSAVATISGTLTPASPNGILLYAESGTVEASTGTITVTFVVDGE